MLPFLGGWSSGTISLSLKVLPKRLWLRLEWNTGPAGNAMDFIARGNDRAVYDAADNLVADAFPMLVAKMSVRLFTATGACATYPFHAACQEKAVLADRLLQGRGESFAFQWLAYTGCVLLYLSSCGITVRDCGGFNLAVSGNTALEALPRLLFIDCLSWTEEEAVSCNWSGYFSLVRTYASSRRSWLVAALAGRRQKPDQCFNTLAMECQAYAEHLVAAGVMVNGRMSTRNPFQGRQGELLPCKREKRKNKNAFLGPSEEQAVRAGA